ncbi:MAG: HPF/RaiA family ribosome-associated protein [Oligoflexia bacterium]|nr:HPF/RaiA family ribosome-associated protein [Oligoflexia bacterium]
MHIQINTDSNIEGHEKITEHFKNVLKNALDQFLDRITRLEVHLSDENSHKKGVEDKRCLIEARLEGMKPLAVTHKAETLDHAVDGAIKKLKSMLDRNLKQQQKRSSRITDYLK